MTHPKTKRNARIVRLRDSPAHYRTVFKGGVTVLDGKRSFEWIGERVSHEFPEYDDDGKLLIITRQRAQQIYKAEKK